MSAPNDLSTTLARINARAWGIATGLILGFGLFLATNILVLRGGPDVGQHLNRLVLILPGYSVSFVGSFVGLIYGFVVGYGLGRLIGPRSALSRDGRGTDTTHVRVNGKAWGLTLGASGALVLFVVTNVLELRGGENVGAFLQNLRIYFPGYTVDRVGSLIGAAYVLAIGFALGEVIGFVYNRAVERAEG